MIPLKHPKSGGSHVAKSEREAAALRLHGWVDADEPSEARHVGGGWYELADGRKVRGNPNTS